MAAFDRDEVKLHIQSAHGDLMVTIQHAHTDRDPPFAHTYGPHYFDRLHVYILMVGSRAREVSRSPGTLAKMPRNGTKDGGSQHTPQNLKPHTL